MIHAQNMDRCVDFYTDVLGLEKGYVSEYWSELKFGDAIIGVHGGGDGSNNPTGLSLQYSDVKAAHESAVNAGATSIVAPHQREGEPIMLGQIRDTEGNEIMLTQYVG